MKILTFTECAGIRATEDGPRLVHAEVWREYETGDLFAAEALSPVPDELRGQAELPDLGWFW